MNAFDTALLLLDLQNEMVDSKGKVGGGGLAKVVQERRVLETASGVLEAARAKGLQIAHVRLGFRPDYADALSVAPRIAKLKESRAAILGTWGTEFPEILAPHSDEMVITKQCVNPFFNTGLLSWLHKNGVKQIAIGGVATNLVVEATARYGDDAGLAVVVIEDCCAAPNPQWHRFSIENTLPLFARVTTAAEFINSL
jgi:biuret amidohydrolase